MACLSYRVAIPRHCSAGPNCRSTTLRPAYTVWPRPGGRPPREPLCLRPAISPASSLPIRSCGSAPRGPRCGDSGTSCERSDRWAGPVGAPEAQPRTYSCVIGRPTTAPGSEAASAPSRADAVSSPVRPVPRRISGQTGLSPNGRRPPPAAPRIDREPLHEPAGTVDGSAPRSPQPVQDQAAQCGEPAYSHECPIVGLRTVRVAESGEPSDEEEHHRQLAEDSDGDDPQPPPRGIVSLLPVIRRERCLTGQHLDVDLLHGEGDAVEDDGHGEQTEWGHIPRAGEIGVK